MRFAEVRRRSCGSGITAADGLALHTLVTNIESVKRWDRTHAALKRAALELFAERGYDAAGTAQIAARAQVSEMTLFRHFATKEALLLEDPFDPRIAAGVASRPGGEPAMRALAEGIRQAWREVDPESTQLLREVLRIVAHTPALTGAIERNSNETITVLTQALTERDVHDLEARVAASAMITGLSVALLDWAQTEQGELSAVLDAALDVLGGQ